MSEIKLTRKHSLALTDAKKIAQKAADELARKYDLESQWDGDTLHFSRSGIDGRMHVTASRIDLTVKLGLLLRPFRLAFEENIEKNLTKLLDSPATPAGTGKSSATKLARSSKPAAKASNRKA